jgi:very-short-patch-repair endonuclease
MQSGLIRSQKVSSETLKFAKWMRRNMTLAERCFWNVVRTERFGGLHFRRQQVIHGFIADFYCEALGLIIEIDGGIHEQQHDYDSRRDMIMNRHGIQVIRFSNEDVIMHSDQVLARVRRIAGL